MTITVLKLLSCDVERFDLKRILRVMRKATLVYWNRNLVIIYIYIYNDMKNVPHATVICNCVR